MTLPDCRALLREGDAMTKAAEYVAAIRLYAEAARVFDASAQNMKAVAVFRQVRDLIAKHAPGERALDDEARSRLPALYRSLGLVDDAEAVENEPPKV
jgi:hypothetical protein